MRDSTEFALTIIGVSIALTVILALTGIDERAERISLRKLRAMGAV